MKIDKIRTLVLYAQFKGTDLLSYYDDWMDAFIRSEGFSVTSVNICNSEKVNQVQNKIKEFDLIVLLHSTNGNTLTHINSFKNVLKDRTGKLIVFVGNEVNLPHVSMSEKIRFIYEIEADFIGTQLPIKAGEWLYSECKKSKVVALPHALNPEAFKPKIPQKNRTIDIGVRSNLYPAYIGDTDRNDIFNYFSTKKISAIQNLDINTDMSARFNRSGWASFLNNCKGTISTEAGSFYLEKDDKTVKSVENYILATQKKYIIKRKSIYHRTWCLFPQKFRNLLSKPLKNKLIFEGKVVQQSNFEEIYNKFFKNYPRPPFYSKCISSRHFDAIGAKTCQIMFQGEFNGILEADINYIKLNRDFSNIDDAIVRFKDLTYRKNMTDTTHEYIMDQHTYKHRIFDILKIVQSN